MRIRLLFLHFLLHLFGFGLHASYSAFLMDDGSKCPGYCTNEAESCRKSGGRITGFCSNSLSCCDPLLKSTPQAHCGEIIRGLRVVHFRSPSYPKLLQGNLLCSLEVKLLSSWIGLRVDFLDAVMEGPAFVGSGDGVAGSCEEDAIHLRGFKGGYAPPSRCGNLTGYSFFIERSSHLAEGLDSLSILGIMASQQPGYRWNIRVVQLLENSHEVTGHFYQKNPVKHLKENYYYKKSANEGFKEKRSLLEDLLGTESQLNFFKTQQVIGGEPSSISSSPWLVSFRYRPEYLKDTNASTREGCDGNEGVHFCGGSIIGENLILTASHCFYSNSKQSPFTQLSYLMAVAGDSDLCTSDPGSSFHSIQSVTFHLAYDSNLLLNDVALVRVKEAFDFTRDSLVKAIKLASNKDKNADFAGEWATLSGWGEYLSDSGQLETGENEILDFGTTEQPETLPPNPKLETPDRVQRSAQFLLQNRTACNLKEVSQYLDVVGGVEQMKKYKKYADLFEDTICSYSNVSSGKGDSGGGLVLQKGLDEPVLIGVVSYGISDTDEDAENGIICRTKEDEDADQGVDLEVKAYDFFASVPFYRDWIDLASKSVLSEL